MTALANYNCRLHLRSTLVALAALALTTPVDAATGDALTHSTDTDAAIASCLNIIATDKPTWPIADVDTLLQDSITRSPFRNPRGQTGTRLAGNLANGTNIIWTSIDSNDTLVAMQITTAIDSRPMSFWHLDEKCDLSQQRTISYDDKFNAIELRIINPADGSVEAVEPLNPPVPPATKINTESLGLRVGLVDAGVNYTLPEINNRLARDSRGDLIGFDFWDNDALPFDAQFGPSAFHVIRHGTGTASLLLAEAPFVEFVPYRYPRPDMSRMRALVEHASANNVRIVGLPLGGNKIDQWQDFADAAIEHPDILFIASAGNNGRNIDRQPVYPAALDLPNLLVVTSADDFVVPAERVNWGRTHVDYMLPAEERATINFFGQQTKASGSSYAVPRAMAMAARWLRDKPQWRAPELIAEFARRYADGGSARYVNGGYIADPLANDEIAIELIGVQTLTRDKPEPSEDQQRSFKVPLSVFALSEGWSTELISQSLLRAESILKQCNISFNSVTISQLSIPDYLQDLATGPAKTLISALDNDSEFRPIKVFFARDTNMLLPTDGASFARGNTRRRPWLQDSVWLMENIEHVGEALAHELFHVLSNSGGHNRNTNNLMQPRTSPENIEIQPLQCEAAINQGKNSQLLFD